MLIDWPPICSSPFSVLAMKELLGGFYYTHNASDERVVTGTMAWKNQEEILR